MCRLEAQRLHSPAERADAPLCVPAIAHAQEAVATPIVEGHPETTGWVDYVVTPVGAFGLMVGEAVRDRYFVRWTETHVHNRAFRASLRVIFGPSRFLANTAEGRLPWYRPERTLAWGSSPVR